MNPIAIPLSGGLLIGSAAALLLLFNGRILGVSGILGNAFSGEERGWRISFLAGMAVGGLLLQKHLPQAFDLTYSIPVIRLVVAGLLVGYGSRLASGCTSGHGICGVSRLSLRSIVAIVLFIAAGALTVAFLGDLQ